MEWESCGSVERRSIGRGAQVANEGPDDGEQKLFVEIVKFGKAGAEFSFQPNTINSMKGEHESNGSSTEYDRKLFDVRARRGKGEKQQSSLLGLCEVGDGERRGSRAP